MEVQSSQSFEFDAIGNRKKQTTQIGDQKSILSYKTNALNQRTEVAEQNPVNRVNPVKNSRGHDHDGNLLEDAKNSYTWNAENRLIRVDSKDHKTRTEYAYDYQGRRTTKRTSTRATKTENFKLKTENVFIYDGWNLLAEIEHHPESNIQNPKSNIADTVRTYTWGRDLSGSLQGAGGVGGLLAISESKAPASGLKLKTENLKLSFAIYDANGNVGQMIAEDSSIKAAYQYSAFGSVTATFGEEAAENPWRFSTKPVEANTGWSYYGFRYYDAGNGRWASRDPIEESGGINLYGFIGNDGVGKWDFLGEACCNSETASSISYGASGITLTFNKQSYAPETQCCVKGEVRDRNATAWTNPLIDLIGTHSICEARDCSREAIACGARGTLVTAITDLFAKRNPMLGKTTYVGVAGVGVVGFPHPTPSGLTAATGIAYSGACLIQYDACVAWNKKWGL